MRLGDTISLKICYSKRNEDGDVEEHTTMIPFASCIIMPNDKAREIKGVDGKAIVYSFMLLMKKPKKYPIVDGKIHIDTTEEAEWNEIQVSLDIPLDGATVHITKEDKSIDRDCKITGFVTIKNWIKIWI